MRFSALSAACVVLSQSFVTLSLPTAKPSVQGIEFRPDSVTSPTAGPADKNAEVDPDPMTSPTAGRADKNAEVEPSPMTSSTSSADKEVKFGLHEHNDTHSRLHMSGPKHHSSMLVPKHVVNMLSGPLELSSDPHVSAQTAPSSEEPDSSEDRSPSVTAPGSEERRSQNVSSSEAQNDGLKLSVAALPEATEEAGDDAAMPSISGDLQKVSSTAYFPSSTSGIASDSPILTETDSSEDSPSPDEESSFHPAPDVDSSRKVTSPATPNMNPPVQDPSASNIIGEETTDNDPNANSKNPGADSKTDKSQDNQTEEEESEEEEDETSSSEEEEEEEEDDAGIRAPVVDGTVKEGQVLSDADKLRERNVTTFALVMCGTVGATFVVLIGVWINRMRHNDRVRRLQDEEDEEFTVFSAHDTRFNTTSSGRYTPLR